MPRNFKKSTLRVSVPKKAKAKAVEKLKVNNIKKIVKRVIRNEAELKCAPLYTIADQQMVYGAGLNPASALGWVSTNIIPPVTQGSGDGQRIGNKINHKYFRLNYTLRAYQVTSVVNPFPATPLIARVIVYRQKYAIDDSSPLQILDSGNGAQNIGSTPDDFFKPYNKKMFTILYSRQYYMQPIRNETTTPISSDNVANGTKAFIARRLRLKIPTKKFIYADTTTTPSNVGYFMAVCMCNQDGTVVNNTQGRLMVNAESLLYYTDE